MNTDSMNGKLISAFLLGALVATVIISTLLLALGKVAPKSSNNSTSTVTEILDYHWYLQTGGDADEAVNTYITFSKEGTAGGNGGCNLFGADYSTNKSQITIKDIFSTKIYCDATSKAETDFFAALVTVNSFEVKDKTLVLKTPNGTLKFSRYEKAVTELLGEWELVKFVEGSKQIAKVSERSTSLTFRATGEVFGTACNRFGGKYEVKTNGAITFSNLITTDMSCEPASFTAQEVKLIQNLNSATSFEVKETTLRVFYGDNSFVEFQRAS